MDLSKNVFKTNENWNENLLQETTLNVVSFLSKNNFKTVKLKLLVPFKRKKRLINGTDQETKQSIDESNACMRFMEFQNETTSPLIFEMLIKTVMNNQNVFRSIPNFEFSASKRITIYEDDWVNSISSMFTNLKDEVKTEKEDKVHVIYIIDSSLFKGIPYQDGIDFVNYIAF